MWIRLTVLFAVLFSPIVLLAQPLADRVPDDAILYIGWRGSESMGPGFEGSHLKAVMEASQVSQIFSEFLPKLVEKLGQENREASEIVQLISAVGGPMWRHPSAFYFGGIDFSNPRMPTPRMALLCDAGTEAQALLEQVNKALEMAGPTPMPITAAAEGNLVVIKIGPANLADAGAALAGSNAFKEALAKVQKDPVAAAYIDFERLLEVIDQGVAAEGDPHAMEKWPKAREALGLNGLKRMVYTGGFDGKEWADHAFISAPAPRSGLLALGENTPLNDDAFKVVPQAATMLAAGKLNLSRMFAEIRTAAGKIDPNAPAQIDQGIQQVQQILGLDVQKDILDPLGDTWVVYTSPGVGGDGLLGMVLVNALDDPAKAEQSLSRLEQFANGMIQQQMEDAEVMITLKQTQVGDLTIHYLAVPFVTPSWAVKDGNLYAGLYPQIVAAAADHVSSKGKSILENETFLATRKKLGGEKASAIQFVDLPKTVANGYSTWLLLMSYIKMGDLFGVPTPAIILPPLNTLAAHMTPAGSVSWSDESGWHMRSTSPFPGSTALATDPMNSLITTMPVMMMGISMPALGRARETANRVKCAANERTIGQAILLYSNENRGQYPPDLGTLLLTQDIKIDTFICPSAGDGVPAEVRAMPLGQQADWVNQNSDYIYLGAGMTIDAGPETVTVHENFENHDHDGINMLFGDGHVEFVLIDRAMEMIQKQPEKPALPRGGGL